MKEQYLRELLDELAYLEMDQDWNMSDYDEMVNRKEEIIQIILEHCGINKTED